jgi:hypothetical protein
MIDLDNFIELAHLHSYKENRGQFVLNDFSEKLVELVILECVGVADTYIQTGEHARPTSRSTIGRLIKQHFELETEL